ncbi:MAG: hypothetical protein QW658_02690, partial [Candidatus Bathyarchaeia archaeon]
FIATEGAIFRNIGILNNAAPNPTLTKFNNGGTLPLPQTAGFCDYTTGTTGEWQILENIQVRSSREDGFLIVSNEQIVGINLWAANPARYGFYIHPTGDYTGITLINPQMEIAGGWSGSVPSYFGGGTSNINYPQCAALVFDNTQFTYGGSNMLLTLINPGYFDLLPDNGVAMFIIGGGGIYIKGGSLPSRPSSSTSTLPLIVEAQIPNATNYGDNIILEGMSLFINSSYYGLYRVYNYQNGSNLPPETYGQFIFRHCFIYDYNTSTPAVPLINNECLYNPGGSLVTIPAFIGTVKLDHCVGNNTTYSLGSPRSSTLPTISVNPPSSATVYQNTNPFDIRIYLPAYATTSGTAGSVAIALGSTSTPSTIGTKFINGSTSSSATEIIELVVPAGWYYEFTSTGVTFGTATVLPA